MGYPKTGGGDSLVIEDSHIFDSDAQRDTYFSLNPSDLSDGLYCSVSGGLQKYVADAWVDVSATIKGADGADGEDGEDGGSALDARTLALESDSHAHTNKTILDVITAAFTTAYETKLGNVTDYFKGIFADSTARDAAILTPVDGNYCKQIDTGSFWFYGNSTWVDSGSTNTGDMIASIYDPQGINGDAFNRANHAGLQAIATIADLQTTLDGLVEKENGKGLSQEDFTTTLSNTLENLDASNPNPSSYWGTLENEPSSSVKTKIFRVTFPSDDSDFSVAHSLPSGAEVISLQCGFRYSGNTGDARQYMPPNFTDSDDFHYQIYCNTSSVTIRQISASNLYGRTGSLIITYIT